MRAKIGYMAILVLMGFLYLWTNVAVTFYLFFGLLLFAVLSLVCSETFDNAFAGEARFESGKHDIDLCKKYRNYSLLPGVNERNDCKLPDRFFLLF